MSLWDDDGPAMSAPPEKSTSRAFPEIISAGFYVCLERCGAPFGNTYLREAHDMRDDELATTGYPENATHFPTRERALQVYEMWLAASTSKLAETHRRERARTKETTE